MPDALTMKRHRDLVGRRWHMWLRRGFLTVLLAVCVLGLLDAFGQRSESATTSTPAAELELRAPAQARGGLMFQARFTITAREELKDARVVLDEGWIDGLTMNTIEPSPLGEASADGKLSFDLGHVPAGERYVLYLQLQVNPTSVGRRTQRVALYDGKTLVLTRDHSLTIFP